MSHGIMNGLFVQAAGAIASGLLGYIGGLETRAVVTHPSQRKFLNREETKLREKWLQGIKSVKSVLDKMSEGKRTEDIKDYVVDINMCIVNLETLLMYYQFDSESILNLLSNYFTYKLYSEMKRLADWSNPFTPSAEKEERTCYHKFYLHAKAYLNALIGKYNDILPLLTRVQALTTEDYILPLLE